MEPVILFKILAVLTTSVFLSNFLRQKIKLPNQLESKRAKTLTSLLQSAVSITIFVVGFFLVLSILGIDIKPLLASAGIIGIAIGFGSQTLVKDLINGLFLLAEDSIAVGDLVEIGNKRGLVEKINIRTIILKDETGALHVIPAGAITQLTNLSKGEARLNLDLTLPINLPIDRLFALIKDELKTFSLNKTLSDMLVKKPEFKGIEDLQPNKMLIRLVFYTKNNYQGKVKREFLYRLKKRLEKEKLTL